MMLGSLCTGYGGLDLAAEALLGARTVWCAEFEDAPSRVIAARFPGVPNLHDVKRIPWWLLQPVDALTAGYPCQPFSLAGARKGEDDPRHLWPSIAEGIGILRPRHVLLENVRGHLSLGFDQVLHDLDALGYAVAWRILSAAAVGACHRRERLFIYAQPVEHVGEPEGPVLAVAGTTGWVAAEADLFGERAEYREPLPVAGVMRNGRIHAARVPQAPIAGPLFPTPDASVANDGEGPETWLARRERVKSKGINGNGMGMPLSIAVQLLPTPTTEPDTGNGHARNLGQEMRLLPTPEAKLATAGPDYARAGREGSGGHDLITAVALLPTPYAYEGQRGGAQDPEKRRAGGHSVALSDVIAFETRGTDWGKYAGAIERHARMLARASAAPTQPNSKGNRELAPTFVEWMMCLPDGWVTDPSLWSHLTPRKAREAQLKMLGNGVVPVQALAAYRSLAEVASRGREEVGA